MIAADTFFQFEGARRYAAQRGLLFKSAPLVAREDSDSLSELELQSLWFAGRFGRSFRSIEGQEIEIIQFGHWNHAAGPDFVDTAVRIDGDVRTGAIELDPDVRDWERHGHAENPGYENVVLHLYFHTGSDRFFTRTASHRAIPQVQLNIQDVDDWETAGFALAEAHLGRCSYVFHQLPRETVAAILEAAAQYRLERKARLMRRTMEIHGREQALYQGIAEALGYRHNAFPMRVLSQRASLARISDHESVAIDALLFGLAGFLEGHRHVESSDESTTNYQRDLWSLWWRERESGLASPAAPLPWRTGSTRPQNHPQRRLGALARLAANWKTFRDLALAKELSIKALESYLFNLEHPYWSHHYTLRAKRAKQPMALIGKARLYDILANQLFPLRFDDAPEATWDAYIKLPALLDNEKVRRASLRLFGQHPDKAAFSNRLFHQQALLQVYDDFCLTDASECDECPFPEELWASATS